jgi:hypothetical protein
MDSAGSNWRKSTASGSGNCVEVAFGEQTVRVRDSKNIDGKVLEFSNKEWATFVADLRLGTFATPGNPH